MNCIRQDCGHSEGLHQPHLYAKARQCWACKCEAFVAEAPRPDEVVVDDAAEPEIDEETER